MKPNRIHNLLILFNKMKFIFGTKRLTIKHGHIVQTSKTYKAYSFILGISIFTTMLFYIKESIKNLNDALPVPLSFSIIIALCMMTLVYFITMFYDAFSKSFYSLKIYKTMADVDDVFCVVQNSAIQKFLYLYLAARLCCILYEFIIWFIKFGLIQITLQIVHTTIELEIVNYVLNVNEVTRNFERLNHCLKMMETKEDFDIQDGFMISFWKSKNLNIDKRISLRQLMVAFDKLTDVVDDFRAFYGLQVN